MLGLALVVTLLVILVGLWAPTAKGSRESPAAAMYLWLVGIQFLALGVWVASACGHTITRERELRTWDFVRTTRLTAGELLVGKLLGAPVTAYFALACALLPTAGAGLVAGFGVPVVGQTYVLLVAYLLFVGLVGLLFSMVVERSSMGVVAFLALLVVWPGLGGGGPFGWGALSVLPGLTTLHGVAVVPGSTRAALFGVAVSPLWRTVVLYAAIGAWLVLMIVRNLKRDRDQIQLLSRWQGVGFVAFLDVLFFAVIDPILLERPADLAAISLTATGLNGVILLLAGLAMLTPPERLRGWWRRRAAGEAAYAAPDGPVWPWLVVAGAAGYAVLVAAALVLGRGTPLGAWQLPEAGVRLAILGVFIVRDVLFLQWCTLTRLRQPVVRGILMLGLYYITANVLTIVAGPASDAGRAVRAVMTPLMALAPDPVGQPAVYVGLVLQLAASLVIARATAGRLARPPRVAAAPTA
jgi:hypothetical protein